MTYTDTISSGHVADEARVKHIVSKNIKKYREALNYTQEMLAQAVSMAPITISKLETAQLWPSARTLASLSQALRVSPYQLYLDDDNDNVVPKDSVLCAFEQSIKAFSSNLQESITLKDISYIIDHSARN